MHHGVDGVAGHRELQPLAGLRLDVAGVAVARTLRAQRGTLGAVGLQLLRGMRDVAAADQVTRDRGGEHDDEQDEHTAEHQRASGEDGPGALCGGVGY